MFDKNEEIFETPPKEGYLKYIAIGAGAFILGIIAAHITRKEQVTENPLNQVMQKKVDSLEQEMKDSRKYYEDELNKLKHDLSEVKAPLCRESDNESSFQESYTPPETLNRNAKRKTPVKSKTVSS